MPFGSTFADICSEHCATKKRRVENAPSEQHVEPRPQVHSINAKGDCWPMDKAIWAVVSSCFEQAEAQQTKDTSQTTPEDSSAGKDNRHCPGPDEPVSCSSTELIQQTTPREKRQRNVEAARRYRKRKVDQIGDLETALSASQKELETTRLRLARVEAEVEVLRRLLAERPSREGTNEVGGVGGRGSSTHEDQL